MGILLDIRIKNSKHTQSLRNPRSAHTLNVNHEHIFHALLGFSNISIFFSCNRTLFILFFSFWCSLTLSYRFIFNICMSSPSHIVENYAENLILTFFSFLRLSSISYPLHICIINNTQNSSMWPCDTMRFDVQGNGRERQDSKQKGKDDDDWKCR